MKRFVVEFSGKKLHLVIGKLHRDWLATYGDDENFWGILFEELLDGSVEVNEGIWYWYIDGRCYETTEEV